MRDQPADEPQATYDQRGQHVYGPQTHIADGVSQYGGLFNTGIIQGNIVIPPPQPTLATPPAPPPDFVGRTEQLAQIAATLTAGRSAAITALQGMGGIGKTALAQQLAAMVTAHFSGGIFWADLALHTGSAETILRAWGGFCGADLSQEPNPVVLSERVRALLAMRREAQGALLAVLDDVRAEWLTTARLLKQSLPAETPLLLTTRDVDLAAALDADVVRLDVLPEENAYELLATRVKPQTILTPEATVKALLQQLGYLPLAIRLAAGHVSKLARKPGFDLNQFVADVAQRAMSLLDAAGGSGLAATFAISYDTLTAEQQRIFRHCSVYSPALLTVEHMAGLLDVEFSVVEIALDELVAVALLDWDQETKGRYVLHPLLRQYGHALLGKIEGTQSAHRQAAQHLQEKSTDPDRGGTPIELLEEVDHWEQAAEWATFIRVVSDLVGSLDHLGYWREIDRRLAKAQTHLQEHPIENLATILLSRGTIAFKQARWNDAIDFYQQALTAYEQRGDLDNMATTWMNLGNVYHRQGGWDKAIDFYQQALATFQQLDKRQSMAQTLGNLGLVYESKGEWNKAIGFYRQALKIYRQTDDHQGIAQIGGNLGNIYQRQSEWDKAIDFYQQASVAFEKRGDIQSMASTYNNLGLVYQNKSEWDRAIGFYQQALASFAHLDDIYGKANVYNNLGSTYQSKSEWDKAISFYQQAILAFEQLGDTYGIAQTYGNLSVFYNKQGNATMAANYMAHAYLLFRRLGATQSAQQAGTMLVNLFGSIDANKYMVQVMENKQIETRSEVSKGLMLEALLDLIIQTRLGDYTFGEQLYRYFLTLSVDTAKLPEIQDLSKVLIRILVGINNPDLSALTAETAKAVQSMLNQLRVK